MSLTSKVNLLNGLKWSRNQIIDLRRVNKGMSIELKAYNRILTALESHKPSESVDDMTPDHLYDLEDSIKQLEIEIMDKKPQDCPV